MQKKKSSVSNFRKIWLPLFLFVVAVIIFYKVVDRLPQVFATIFDVISVVSPFIGGLVIAFILYKPAYALESLCVKSNNTFLKKHARGLSVLSCYLALILILAVILYLLFLLVNAKKIPTKHNAKNDDTDNARFGIVYKIAGHHFASFLFIFLPTYCSSRCKHHTGNLSNKSRFLIQQFPASHKQA